MSAVSKEDIQIIVTEIHHIGREIHEMVSMLHQFLEISRYPRQYQDYGPRTTALPDELRYMFMGEQNENKPVGWDK
jgi:hypothetical protein